METLRIHYLRKQTLQLQKDFETIEAGVDWEFQIPDGVPVEQEFDIAFDQIKGILDAKFSANASAVHVESADSRAVVHNVVNEKEAERKPAVDTSGYATYIGAGKEAIVEGLPVFLENGRVWEIKQGSTKTGKQYVSVKVGNKENVPTGYAWVKSFNPALMNRMRGLAEGDHINIWGRYEGWDGSDGRMYDFYPERIERRD